MFLAAPNRPYFRRRGRSDAGRAWLGQSRERGRGRAAGDGHCADDPTGFAADAVVLIPDSVPPFKTTGGIWTNWLLCEAGPWPVTTLAGA